MAAIGAIFTTLMMISLLGALIGVFRPSAVLFKSKGEKTRKRAVSLYCKAALFFFFGAICISAVKNMPQHVDQKEVVKKQSTPRPIPFAQQRSKTAPHLTNGQQDRIKNFIDRFMTADSLYAQKIREMTEVSEKMKTGQASFFELYEAMASAHAEVRKAWLKSGDMKIPDDIPEDIEENLKKAIEQLNLSEYCKMNALEHGMDWCDSKKPSDLNGFKEDMKDGSQYSMRAALFALEAQSLAGIEPEAQETDS